MKSNDVDKGGTWGNPDGSVTSNMKKVLLQFLESKAPRIIALICGVMLLILYIDDIKTEPLAFGAALLITFSNSYSLFQDLINKN